MNNYNLSFITNQDLFNHVKETVLAYRFHINLKEFNKNIIDPIKITFDSKVYNQSLENVIENEILRQIDKSNTNHIGYFHQNIFRYIGEGWTVPNHGYDIENKTGKIYVEMKNKHNTMNSASSQKTYMKMQNTLLQDQNATCFLVEVIAKNSQNIPWICSVDGVRMENSKIRRLSIDKFYETVTGDKYSFLKLCQVLPKVISDVLKEVEQTIESNSVFSDLKQLSPNLLKSLYLLSFKKYEGFNNFNFEN